MFLKTLLLLLVLLAALAATLAAAVIWGGPGPIAPLASINEPFAKVDYSALPAPSHYTAQGQRSDGSPWQCRVVANPLGYARKGEQAAFQPRCVVTV